MTEDERDDLADLDTDARDRDDALDDELRGVGRAGRAGDDDDGDGDDDGDELDDERYLAFEGAWLQV